MPSIPLVHPTPQQQQSEKEKSFATSNSNPLPHLLHTPTGLALLELQGSVLSSHTLTEEINLGRLVFPSSNDDPEGEWDGKRVFLFVGKHQRMAGEVRKLGKAVAVVRRKEGANEKGGGMGEGEGSGDGGQGEGVEIEGIVRYKILFGSRPEPMGAEQKIVTGAVGGEAGAGSGGLM